MPKLTPSRRSGRPAVVVEIASDWLKIAQVESVRGRTTITKLHLEKVTEDEAAVSRSLADAMRKHRFARVPVLSYMPRQMVNTRVLELPSTDTDEIADMIDLQIGKQTPYSKDEIVVDYRLAGVAREGYTRVLLAIAQRSVVRERFYALEEAGMGVARMAISSEGILSWFNHTQGELPSSEPFMLLDIDSFFSEFAVVQGGLLLFTRSILLGSNQLVSERGQWRDKLASEIKQSIEICRAEVAGFAGRMLLVTGAGAKVPDLVAELNGQLGLPVEGRDCLQDVDIPEAVGSPVSAEMGVVSLTPLIGVGLAPEDVHLDLVPDSVQSRRNLLTRARHLGNVGVLIMLVLLSGSLLITMRLFARKARLDRLAAQLAAAEPHALAVRRNQDIVSAFNEHMAQNVSTVDVLSALHAVTPEGVLLSEMRLDRTTGQIVMEGGAEARSDVSALVKNLEDSSVFRGVMVDGQVSRDRKTGRYVFKITCSLEAGS